MKRFLTLALAMLMLCTALFTFASCSNDSEVKVIDVKLTDEEYAFVMKKDNLALKADFDAFLQQIKDNGSFQTIVDKYFKGTGEKVGVPVATNSIVNDENTFVVVTNCPFEPFEYIGDDGKIYGLDIEIAKMYAEAKGLTLAIKNLPDFDSIFTQVDAGYADIGMAGITVTEKRQLANTFTATYYNASQKLIVMADNTDFDGLTTVEQVEAKLKELQGKSIGYQNGTTGNWYVAGSEDWGYDGFANITAKGYATALDAINDMINGNLYAVVVDEAPGAAMVAGVNGK